MGFSGDMIFLAFLGLLLFGPRKLPEMARTFGRLVADFKRASSELQGRFNEEVGQLELEDPTKNLLGSLADGLKALHSVREPVKAVMALAEPEKIKAQLSGPSFITNLSEYVNKTRAADKTPAADQPATQSVVAADNNSATDLST